MWKRLEMTGARLKVTTARVGAGGGTARASTVPEASEYWYCCRWWNLLRRMMYRLPAGQCSLVRKHEAVQVLA